MVFGLFGSKKNQANNKNVNNEINKLINNNNNFNNKNNFRKNNNLPLPVPPMPEPEPEPEPPIIPAPIISNTPNVRNNNKNNNISAKSVYKKLSADEKTKMFKMLIGSMSYSQVLDSVPKKKRTTLMKQSKRVVMSHLTKSDKSKICVSFKSNKKSHNKVQELKTKQAKAINNILNNYLYKK
jgi:hypothetical protein